MINITSKALPDAIVVGGRAFLLKTDYRVWIRFSQDFKAWKKMGYRGVIDIKYLFENDIPAFSEADDYSGILEFAFPQNAGISHRPYFYGYALAQVPCTHEWTS